MAKNPEAERQSVAELITLLLQERKRRHGSNTLTAQNNDRIRGILSHVLLWKHSEADGDKYLGCRFWSTGALESLSNNGKVVTRQTVCGDDALRHEHLFPRKQLIAKLFSISDPTVTKVREILDRLNIAVEDVWSGKEKIDFMGHDLAVVSRKGLIKMKRLAGRPQDLADIDRLENERD